MQKQIVGRGLRNRTPDGLISRGGHTDVDFDNYCIGVPRPPAQTDLKNVQNLFSMYNFIQTRRYGIFFPFALPVSFSRKLKANKAQLELDIIAAAMSSIITPPVVLRKGLAYVGVNHETQAKWSASRREDFFHKHFGSSPLVIATVWYDLCHTSIRDAQILEKEKSEKGFLHFMTAHYFLWTYPKNVELMVSQFGLRVCERYLQGNELWYWPKKIAALKESKIIWHSRLNDGNTAHMAVSVDGVNHAAWEKKHPTLNKDPAYYDHKHHCCGYKYEIALEVYFEQIAWIKGPIRCGKGDRDIFRDDGLRELLMSTPGKMRKRMQKRRSTVAAVATHSLKRHFNHWQLSELL